MARCAWRTKAQVRAADPGLRVFCSAACGAALPGAAGAGCGAVACPASAVRHGDPARASVPPCTAPQSRREATHVTEPPSPRSRAAVSFRHLHSSPRCGGISVKVGFITLGCDKNTVDSERYLAQLAAHGIVPADDLGEAELIVVNTCGFIDAAKKESIDAMLEAHRLKEDGACQAVVAVGCMVQRHKSELQDALPEVDLFLGSGEMDRLLPELERRGLIDAGAEPHPGERIYTGDLPHVRYLKVSEGCDHGCAFCAIPLMRGRHRSFCAARGRARSAAAGAAGCARGEPGGAGPGALGARPSRQRTATARPARSARGRDVDPMDPAALPLLGRHHAAAARRGRAGAAHPALSRHADPARVRRGARAHAPARAAADASARKVAHFRAAVPDLAIRTTCIVGFPGETEDDFQQLLEFLEEVQFERVGAFTYSPQEGTRADEMRGRRARGGEARATGSSHGAAARDHRRAVRAVARAGRCGCSWTVRAPRTDRRRPARRGRPTTWMASPGCTPTAPAGSFVEARIDDVMDDYDFSATATGVVELAPARPAAASQRGSCPCLPWAARRPWGASAVDRRRPARLRALGGDHGSRRAASFRAA